ncbi:MAG: TonB-dependent receptor [Prevotella sp.]|nr:TonB-dependent receptor [Prevotella sp.]
MMKQVNFRIPLRMLVVLFGLVLSIGAYAQITVKGHVKDSAGEPVIGATIRVAGQQGGTVSDFDGNFTLKAPEGATLNVTYIGYQPANVKAAANVVVVLKDDSQMLENVVVIGYGVARKTDLTGSVIAIKPDEKNHGMVTTAQDMLQGKVAGVNINSSTGEPGGGAQIRIRGGASLNANNEPLIVIDGMQMTSDQKGVNNPLALVNPNDIESFTVLKDASATAIYGSRGSNGVIIITTKKGRRNQSPKVSYNGNVSVSAVAKKLDVMNANEYVSFIKDYYGEGSSAWNNLGWKQFNEDGTPNVAAGTYDTDWQDEIFRAGISHDHNVSVAGGLGNTKWAMPYRVSVGYTNQQGILKGSDYSRFTAGFTANPSLLDDHLNINANAKYAYSKTNPGGQEAISMATRMDPTRPVTSSDEMYKNWGGYWQWTKPVSEYDPTFPYARNDDAPKNPVELIDNYTFNKDAHVLLGNFEADYKIHGFEDLHLHMNLAGQYSYGAEHTNNLPKSTYGFYYGGIGENQEKRYNVQATAYAQYLKDFNKDHHFDIMAGYEYSRMKYWGDSWNKSYYPNTYEGTDDDGNALAGKIKSDTNDYWKGQVILVSWLGRMNYSFRDRYLLTVSARYDGSSRFADGHRWGFFPSAAFAWKINSEPFLKDVKSISDLKLRLSWGQTGQQDTGMEYYTPTYVHGTNNLYTYPIGSGNDGTLWKPLTYNEDLTWETTTTYNIGLDFGMWNQRLTMSLDFYKRKTTDLLCKPTIPAGMNFDNTMMLNAGEVDNTGFEFSINGKIIQTNDWFFELGMNAAYNKNKVSELYGGRDKIEAGLYVGQNMSLTYHKVGEPANSFFVYQQVYDADGRPVMGSYVDRNADGLIDDNDRYFYKNIAAPWTGGFNIKLGYKNFDLGTNFRASFGNYVFNDIVQGKMNTSVLYNGSKGYYENSTMAIVKNGWTSYNYPLSDYFVQNASFLKCDNITLGYSFENLFKCGKYEGISGRVYASCSNVFTITNYEGLDPEQPSGLESSVYPRCRTFLFGLNLNF